MSAPYLERLFTHYGTDKGIWGYTPTYAAVLGPTRMHVRRVLEIGICGYRDLPNNVVGASLFCWKDYFPNAEIFGLDNDERFIFHDQQRIQTALCDAYDPFQLLRAIDGFCPNGEQFDVIVDDAVHDPVPQISLMNMLAPYLRHGGHYFMEELCPYKLSSPEDFLDQVKGYRGMVIVQSPTKPECLGVAVK